MRLARSGVVPAALGLGGLAACSAEPTSAAPDLAISAFSTVLPIQVRALSVLRRTRPGVNISDDSSTTQPNSNVHRRS